MIDLNSIPIKSYPYDEIVAVLRNLIEKGIDLTDHEKICLCDAVRVISTYEHLDYFQKYNREESEALKDDEPAE